MAEYTIATKDVEYIPSWDDNRERKEPMVFTLGYLTNAERSRCMQVHVDERGEIQIEPDNELLVKLGVKKIKDFVVNNEKIETARAFAELSGFDPLFAEIATEILTMSALRDMRPLP